MFSYSKNSTVLFGDKLSHNVLNLSKIVQNGSKISKVRPLILYSESYTIIGDFFQSHLDCLALKLQLDRLGTSKTRVNFTIQHLNVWWCRQYLLGICNSKN